MNISDKTMALKDKIISGIEQWSGSMIDSFAKNNPMLIPMSKYVKRGISNAIKREDERISSMIDKTMLFIADEKGNYDMDTFFDDLMSMLKVMPETPFTFASMNGTAGNGIIRIILPDNPLVTFLMGDTGALKITEDDFKELKSILS